MTDNEAYQLLPDGPRWGLHTYAIADSACCTSPDKTPLADIAPRRSSMPNLSGCFGRMVFFAKSLQISSVKMLASRTDRQNVIYLSGRRAARAGRVISQDGSTKGSPGAGVVERLGGWGVGVLLTASALYEGPATGGGASGEWCEWHVSLVSHCPKRPPRAGHRLRGWDVKS